MFIEVREKNGIKTLLNTDYIRRIGTRVNMQNQTVTQIIMSDGLAITPEETYEEIITLLNKKKIKHTIKSILRKDK
mgnify:CR=1 FL=1